MSNVPHVLCVQRLAGAARGARHDDVKRPPADGRAGLSPRRGPRGRCRARGLPAEGTTGPRHPGARPHDERVRCEPSQWPPIGILVLTLTKVARTAMLPPEGMRYE